MRLLLSLKPVLKSRIIAPSTSATAEDQAFLGKVGILTFPKAIKNQNFYQTW